jgi:hypothetical protein
MNAKEERKRQAASLVFQGIQDAVCESLQGLFASDPETREGRIKQALHQAEHALLALEVEANEMGKSSWRSSEDPR